MPNMALIPNAAAQITVLLDVVDGYPDESHKLETEMGDEPLEDGRDVTDHAVARPKELTLTAWVSDIPGGQRPAEAWREIIRLQESVEPFQVVTEWGTYDEMLIKRCQADKVGRGLVARMDLKEIRRVGVVDAELPPETLSGAAAGRSGEVRRGRVALPAPVIA